MHSYDIVGGGGGGVVVILQKGKWNAMEITHFDC